MKVLLMMARRYVEVFREEGEGNWTGALAATLLTMWVEGEGEVATMVPTSWVRDGVSEAVRKDGSLLESVMSGLSLVGSSLSGLGLGSMRIGLQHDESDENDDDGQDGGRDDGADAGPSPRAHANPNPNPNPNRPNRRRYTLKSHPKRLRMPNASRRRPTPTQLHSTGVDAAHALALRYASHRSST